jgi:hypothetical protein
MTVLSLLLCASGVLAEQTLREISWAKLKAEGKLKVGQVLSPDEKTTRERVRIDNSSGEPVTAQLLTIENPGVKTTTYAIRGQVRYEGVEGNGYLEMWSHFPDGKKFFSKGVTRSGPSRRLEGSSDWRLFVLPFHIVKGKDRPVKLELNLVLPGRGTVEIGPLRLVEYEKGEDPLAMPGQWWGERDAGIIGAILGVSLGCVGAVIGCLGGSGRARGFVMAALRAMTAFGIACLAVGVVAAARSQPYAVYYPLLLCGIICTVVSMAVLPGIRKRYEAMELRKMKAQDIS